MCYDNGCCTIGSSSWWSCSVYAAVWTFLFLWAAAHSYPCMSICQISVRPLVISLSRVVCEPRKITCRSWKDLVRKHETKRNTITCATLTPPKKVKTKRKPIQKHHETSKRLANEVNKDVCMNKSLLCLFVKLIDRGNESDALELQHSCYLWCLTVLCLALDHDGL